jgi:hypothetical protein
MRKCGEKVEDREILFRHLADTRRKYEKTDEYREKPVNLADMLKKNKKNRQKKKL